MNNEREFKLAIKKSIRRHKGVYLPLAAPMLAGTPDAFICIPGYAAVLVELKWLGEISREKFSRKVPFTALQMLWIGECHDVNPFTAMGLAGCIYKDKIHAILLAHGTPQFYQLSSCFLTDCSYSTLSAETKVFDIPDMFSKVPIPRLERKKHLIHTDQGSYLTYDAPRS